MNENTEDKNVKVDSAIKLEPVGKLLGKSFFIPSYQRGYRWKEQQVKDLLNDIDEFIELQKKLEKNDGFYCIQPLVVKGIPNKDAAQNIRDAVNKKDKEFIQYIKDEIQTKWEVIDGQQRLTTIFILLSYLDNAKKYSIQYETRKGTEIDKNSETNTKKSDDSKINIGSSGFLSNITHEKIEIMNNEGSLENVKIEQVAESNIDFYHMYNAYQAIVNWFSAKKKSSEEKAKFKDTLLEKVKFIWYESTDEDPIKVFTRLNIGKISLTNAELIKALFLNRSNFSEGDISLKQQEIASEWDKIEYTLQNDEFWLFLNQCGNDNKPTRIDMIFDLICEQDILGVGTQNIGTDQYKTFRYFYNFFKLKKENSLASLKESDKSKIEFCWSKVKNVFQIFEEWYNDLELYHYVGYLVDQGEKISNLLTLWRTAKSKQDFIGELKEKIKIVICDCSNLETPYSINDKKKWKPLLLLHNVQTVIKQNSNTEDAYKLSAFYKFPFHLYKSEKWDVEHIDSNTENKLEDLVSQKEWLQDILLDIPEDVLKEARKNQSENESNEGQPKNNSLYDDIQEFLNSESKQNNDQNTDSNENFGTLYEEIVPLLNKDSLQGNDKNLIWNYCLLDSSTNRSYGNAIFSAKRRTIIEKDKGTNGAIAFVLPCTKNVFLKYYNSSTNVLRAWTREDAKAYLLNINEVLSEAGFISDQKTKIDEKMNEGENNK